LTYFNTNHHQASYTTVHNRTQPYTTVHNRTQPYTTVHNLEKTMLPGKEELPGEEELLLTLYDLLCEGKVNAAKQLLKEVLERSDELGEAEANLLVDISVLLREQTHVGALDRIELELDVIREEKEAVREAEQDQKRHEREQMLLFCRLQRGWKLQHRGSEANMEKFCEFLMKDGRLDETSVISLRMCIHDNMKREQ